MNIIIIGFMGTGKTRIGKLLAEKTKREFIDLDESIEKLQNKIIKDIFDRYGEKHFRDIETEELKKVLEEKKNCVISTGGGVVIKEENRKIIKNNIVVLLTASPEIIYERIKKETHRPLLQVPNPMESIKTLLCSRKPMYQETANIIIDTSNLSPNSIVDEIIKKI